MAFGKTVSVIGRAGPRNNQQEYLRLGLRETLKEKNLSNISWAQYFPWGILFNLQARSPSAHLKLPFLEKSACKVDLELASGS